MAELDDQQPPTADVRKVAAIGTVLVIVLVLLVLGAYVLNLGFAKREARFAAPYPPGSIPPEPRLQVGAKSQRLAHLRKQRERLDSWGWVDRRKGIAHIPIDEAMRMRLETSPAEEQ